jgi:hypothetical protein
MDRTYTRTTRRDLIKLGLATTAILAGASLPGAALAAPRSARQLSLLTSATSTDKVIEWTRILRPLGPNPFILSRNAAMMHLAIFEAVNSIVGTYHPYLGTIVAPAGASPEAAAVAAAHHTLVNLYPASTALLDQARDGSLATIPDGQSKSDGLAVGVAAANAILALRAGDGVAGANSVPYTPGTAPGDWQPTPPGFVSPFMVGWGQVSTFGVVDGTQFRCEPPPELQTGKYARDFNEVKNVGSINSTARPPDRHNVSIFYAGTSPTSAFGETACQVSAAQGKSLAENAQIFALLNMAIADALITSMAGKFYYNLWRPVTAIRAADTDGNSQTAKDATWLPLNTTPPYPTHPGNYSSVACAAREVLEAAFGKSGHDYTLVSSVGVPLTYSAFKQMSDDVYDARIYGGIHFRFEQDAGEWIGARVGKHTLQNYLRPVRGG